MDVSKGKNKRYRKQLTNPGGNKVLQSRPRPAMFVVSFTNFKSRALSRDSSGDRVMSRAEVRFSPGFSRKYYCFEPRATMITPKR